MKVSTLKPLDPATLPETHVDDIRVVNTGTSLDDDTEAGHALRAYRDGTLTHEQYTSDVARRIARDRARHFEQMRERYRAENEASYRADPFNQEANRDEDLYMSGSLSYPEYAQRVRDRMRAIREHDFARLRNAELDRVHQRVMSAYSLGMVPTIEWFDMGDQVRPRPRPMGLTPGGGGHRTHELRHMSSEDFRARYNAEPPTAPPPEAPGMRQTPDALTRRQRLVARFNSLFNSRSTS